MWFREIDIKVCGRVPFTQNILKQLYIDFVEFGEVRGLKKEASEHREKEIKLTSIQVEQDRVWVESIPVKKHEEKRRVFPTIVFVVIILTFVSTAFSVAKYAISQTTDQLASVTSNDFIWYCNLTSGGTEVDEKIIGSRFSKESFISNDLHVDFKVENYLTANGIKKRNSERITYSISITGDGICVIDATDLRDATHKTYSMESGKDVSQEFQIKLNQSTPGTYNATVTVASQTPYIKVYKQEVSFELRSTTQ